MTVGSLFAGIGGFDLGFERAGFDIKWQVEIDPFCRAVLARHFPAATRFDDVRTVGAHNLPAVDVLCGGFPCQDISVAGAGAGMDGERSGLWVEMRRIVSELRPRYVVVENVAALLGRGLGRVLGDLAGLGFDAEWERLRACDFGADHERDRLFIVAFSQSSGRPIVLRRDGRERGAAHPAWKAADPLDSPIDRAKRLESWLCEPAILGSLNGLPPKLVERELGAYGNSILPQIAEWIAGKIQDAEGSGALCRVSRSQVRRRRRRERSGSREPSAV